MIEPKTALEKKIIHSEEFQRCQDFGKVRRGHPEGTVGKHVEQILDYIEEHYKDDQDYLSLRLLALLHDIGKFEGYDRPHAQLSTEIAKKFIDDKPMLALILLHDKPYHFWRIEKKRKKFDRAYFIEIFQPINWKLLIKFRYCDNCSRSQQPSIWFEEKCKQVFMSYQ